MTAVSRDPAGAVTAEDWELVARPRTMRIYAIIAAVAIVVAFAVFGALLRIEDTGVYYRTADQVAIVLIGIFLAVGPLLLLRPRMRAGRRGVTVRNVFSERFIEWDLVRAMTFPEGASWARLELAADEYLPVLAVQINDRMRAVTAVREFRVLAARYQQPPPTDTRAAQGTDSAAEQTEDHTGD